MSKATKCQIQGKVTHGLEIVFEKMASFSKFIETKHDLQMIHKPL